LGEKAAVTKGTVVTINFGPFAGLSGVVISTSPERTIVRIILQGRSVPVEVDTDMIRHPFRDRVQRPEALRPRSRPA
jgi:transcription antitermination factor NusG